MNASASPIENIKAISAGAASCFAHRADGDVLAWGNNLQGQLGVNSTVNAKGAKLLMGSKHQFWQLGTGSNGITTYLLDASN
jgi:alpha-tubulin suppressor-like RCC1 family protein